MAKYQSYNTGQQCFDMINLEQELPEDNRARIIKEIVCNIEVSDFDKNYNNDDKGAAAKNVRMMLGILFLAHVRGITGSRSIASMFGKDLEFKYILGGENPPDNSTIRFFRRRHVEELGKLFSMSVHLGSALGMVDFGALSIDGTKIQAYASLYETKNKRKLRKSIKILSRRMERMLERANKAETDNEKTEFGKRIDNIKKREAILSEFQELLEDKSDEESINRVDPDARLMQRSDGKSIIGYNAQAGVECGEHGLIVSAEISQNATDEKLLEEIRDKAEEETSGEFDVTLGDSGYITYDVMERAAHEKREVLGPDRLYEADRYENNKRGKFAKSQFMYDNENDCYLCPGKQILHFHSMIKSKSSPLIFIYENRLVCSTCKHASLCLSKNAKYRRIHRDYRELLRERMRDRLDSNEGYLLYGKRAKVVEPTFGNIKQNRGIRQFYYRGIEKVNVEWKLICSGINLNKIIRFLQGKDWNIILKQAMNNI